MFGNGNVWGELSYSLGVETEQPRDATAGILHYNVKF